MKVIKKSKILENRFKSPETKIKGMKFELYSNRETLNTISKYESTDPNKSTCSRDSCNNTNMNTVTSKSNSNRNNTIDFNKLKNNKVLKSGSNIPALGYYKPNYAYVQKANKSSKFIKLI